MKLSTNESRASTFLDQWEWTRLDGIDWHCQSCCMWSPRASVRVIGKPFWWAEFLCNEVVTPLVTGTALHYTVSLSSVSSPAITITIIIIKTTEKNGKIDCEDVKEGLRCFHSSFAMLLATVVSGWNTWPYQILLFYQLNSVELCPYKLYFSLRLWEDVSVVYNSGHNIPV